MERAGGRGQNHSIVEPQWVYVRVIAPHCPSPDFLSGLLQPKEGERLCPLLVRCTSDGIISMWALLSRKAAAKWGGSGEARTSAAVATGATV